MGHILVLPEDLRAKLNAANLDANTHNKWVAIGVNTVDDMINRIVNDLNHAYPVLSITSTREENKNTIKSRIESIGNVSMFQMLMIFFRQKLCHHFLVFITISKIEQKTYIYIVCQYLLLIYVQHPE